MYGDMKMKRQIIGAGLSLFSIFTVFAGGCGTEQAPRQVGVEPMCSAHTQVEAVTAAAEDVLARMNFAIDKADVKQGYVRTLPLTGAQAFEFWRKDTVGPFNKSEANLQTVRRTAEVNVSGRDGQVCAECVVTVERMSLPQRPAVSTTRASAMFSRSGPSLQRLELNPEQREGVSWIELGRDSQLETEILKRLQARL
jgi:hypothetical protein